MFIEHFYKSIKLLCVNKSLCSKHSEQPEYWWAQIGEKGKTKLPVVRSYDSSRITVSYSGNNLRSKQPEWNYIASRDGEHYWKLEQSEITKEWKVRKLRETKRRALVKIVILWKAITESGNFWVSGNTTIFATNARELSDFGELNLENHLPSCKVRSIRVK